jgi:nucleotide-binding universal stress UspA family protein
MIKNILVALEHSDACQPVFDYATELARSLNANLNLFNALKPEKDRSLNNAPYSDPDWKTYTKQYHGLEAESLMMLKNLTDQAKAAGIQAQFTQETGNPGLIICQVAQDWSADLVVVGSHGRKGLSEMLLGSVSNYVVHHAPCSVMVVHEPDRANMAA